MGYFGEAAPQRQRLAQALRRLRKQAGVTTSQMAEWTGFSQSKVSRLELGQSVPSAADVQTWARAVGADAGELVDLAEVAGVEAADWRRAARRGLPTLQEDVRRLEASAGIIRNFQPVLVPGLLQTPEYARRVVTAGYPDEPPPDLSAAIGKRMERQQILYDESKRLEFVVAEAALRWRFGPRAVAAEQVDRVKAASTLPSVTVAVLPQDGAVPVWHSHGFQLFEERRAEPPIVHFETLTRGVTIDGPDDVEEYRAAFTRLREAALHGGEAQALLTSIAAGLRKG